MLKKLPIHIKILIGLVLGVIWAFISSAMGWNDFTINWIDPFGTIFIRLLKFIAVPLVLFSIKNINLYLLYIIQLIRHIYRIYKNIV